VSGVRVFRLLTTAATAALVLSGCMQRQGPVAALPRNDLDALAYGQPAYGPVVVSQSGAAIAAPRGFHSRGAAVAAPLSTHDAAYRLDAGDRLRVVVYGQEGLTNSYAIDAGGSITMPLIGAVRARGLTPAALAGSITARLRNGFIREPSVAVEIEAYRPFFILGEVAAPGQYPYVPNMSVEAAVAIAGGFLPRARRDEVMLSHTTEQGIIRAAVPLGTPIDPGDTIQIGERWF
jgi:polysaccharide export outer membrane protein